LFRIESIIFGLLSGGQPPAGKVQARRRTMVSPLTPVMMAGSASRGPAIPFLLQPWFDRGRTIGRGSIWRGMFRECDAVYPVFRPTLGYLRRATCHGF